jgi:DNA-binding NarL/FixJ family response regulator
MPRLDHENLKKATVYIGEKNYNERQELRELFMVQGLKQVVCRAKMDGLRDLIVELPPDLLIISDDFASDVYDLIKGVRHQKIGDNPFMLISMLIDPSRAASLNRAIEAGVDDIIIKPVSAERIQERLRLVTFHRRPFIATDGYVGPERKGENSSDNHARPIPVVNTLLEKVNRREMDKYTLKVAVEGALEKVLQAQLDSQSFRLGEVCERLVEAYDTGAINPAVQADLMSLADVLRDASAVAEKLKDSDLAGLCTSLSSNVDQIATRYRDTTESDADLIRKITTAFKMSMKTPPETDGQLDALQLS